MKLNWAERWVVNNPSRVIQQRWEMHWFQGKTRLSQGAAILETGCGRGAGARIIARAFHPRILHASDLDLRMIRRAEAYLPPRDRQTIRLITADVIRLPYEKETFDAVFGFGVLHHVPDWRAALNEIGRVLKTGGTYFFEELYPGLYQNFLTKRILLHPPENRFQSLDLKRALFDRDLGLQAWLEIKKLGILGIAVKASWGNDR